MLFKILNLISSVFYIAANILYMTRDSINGIEKTTMTEMIVYGGLFTCASAVYLCIIAKPSKLVSRICKILHIAVFAVSVIMFLDLHLFNILFDEHSIYLPRVFALITAVATLGVVLIEVFGKKQSKDKLTDEAHWTCPQCGKADNQHDFCENCGCAKSLLPQTPNGNKNSGIKLNVADISKLATAAVFCLIAILYLAGPVSGLVTEISISMLCGSLALNGFSRLLNGKAGMIVTAVSCIFTLVPLVLSVMFMANGYLGMGGTMINLLTFGSLIIALICAVMNFIFDRRKK